MIFTFYSYKGGVGRSMALANIAELLYEKGGSVLMIDWDLDSPGLETYFPHISQNAKGNIGLLNMLFHYKRIVSQDNSKNVNFSITERTLRSLKRENIPEKILQKFKELKDITFSTEQDFVNNLESKAGKELVNKYRSVILKHVYALQLQFGDISDYVIDVYPSF